MNKTPCVEDQIFLLKAWWKYDHSYNSVSNLFVLKFFDSILPSRQDIQIEQEVRAN